MGNREFLLCGAILEIGSDFTRKSKFAVVALHESKWNTSLLANKQD